MWIHMQWKIILKMEGDSWECIINTFRILETQKILDIMEGYILMLIKYRKHYFLENQFWKVCQGCTTVDDGTFLFVCFKNMSWEL
uniref:Uncharacterized protein n=1 Tax=Arundo donax TaxID=35708 RepID=A0A0A9G828_ARUDO